MIYQRRLLFLQSHPSYSRPSIRHRHHNKQNILLPAVNISKNHYHPPEKQYSIYPCSISPNRLRKSYLSTTTTIPKRQSKKDDQEFQRILTKRLLDTKVGSFNQSSLLELKTAISSWCSLSNHSNTQYRNKTHNARLHAFHQAKMLFDRLIQEFVSSKKINTNEDKDVNFFVDVDVELDIIHSVLDCWRLNNNLKLSNIKAYAKRQDVQGVIKTDMESFGKLGGEILKQCCELAEKYSNGHHQKTATTSTSPSSSFRSSNGVFSQPDAKAFNIVIDGYANLGNVEEATKLFQQMIHLSQENNLPQCRPDRIAYNTLLYAYANANSEQVLYAQKASDMLQNMLDLYQQTGNPDMKPDIIAFGSVIAAYANAAPFSEDAPYQAEELIDTMREMYTSSLIENGGDGEWFGLKPNSYCYTLLITAWKNSNDVNATDRAAELFGQMQQSMNNNNDDETTTMENLTALLSMYGNSGKEDSLDQAEHILNSMISMAETSGDKSMMPSTITFIALLDCFAQSAERKVGGDNGNAAYRAERAVEKMEELYELGNVQLQPKTSVYNALINTWAKSMRPDAGERARDILMKMDDMYEKGLLDVKPNAITFTSIIMAYANVKNGEEAEKVLMEMYKRFQDGDIDCQPNVISFASAINAYANQGRPKEAEHLFSQMSTLPDLDGIEANSSCFNSVLKSYVNSDQRNSLNEALKFLEKLDDMGISDTVSYTLVIEQLSKVGNRWAERQGEKLLERMWTLFNEGNNDVKPHSNIYNSVINLMAKSRDHATRAKSLDLLHELRRKYEQTKDIDLMPNTVTYNATLSAFTKHSQKEDIEKAEELLKEMELLYEEGFGDIKPDMFTFTNLISCYANSGVDGSAERAEDILNYMQESYEKGDLSMRPTKVAFGAVLNAWARAGDARRAEAILDHMESLQDDNDEMVANTVIFNTLINSWAKTNTEREQSGHEAEKILRKMQLLYNEGRGEAKPCRITYNSVLSAYNNSRTEGASTSAKGILEEMESSADNSINPDIITYTTYLSILAKLKDAREKIESAEQIISRIATKKFQLNTFAYDAILRVCAHVNSKDPKLRRKALVLAVKTFSAMQDEQVAPSAFSYSLFFNSIAKHSSGNEQKKLLSHSFRDCCAAGLLNEATLNQLKGKFSPFILESLLVTSGPVDKLQLHHLPPEWSCNSSKNSTVSRTMMRANNRTVHNTGRQKNKG